MICNTIEPTPVDWAKRPIVKQYDNEGRLVVRMYGKTKAELIDGNCLKSKGAELLQDHIDGNCLKFKGKGKPYYYVCVNGHCWNRSKK